MTSHHPAPLQDQIVQWGAVVLSGVMVVCVVLQGVLAVLLPAPLFVLTALVTLALVPPVLMLTAATPRVTVTEAALHIQPRVWQERVVVWADVLSVEPYPLLPTPETEVQRRVFVGRQRYEPVRGVMLVVPGLPPVYRIAGFFAGTGGQPVVALTSRTHTEYNELLKKVERYAPTS